MTADSEQAPGLRCTNCHAPLADDQRYCVECGQRRGGVPPAVAARIEDLLARGDLAALGPGAGVGAGLLDGELGEAELADAGGGAAGPPLLRAMPSPRAAAVAIMAMLAFGVVVGSLAGARAPVPGPVVINLGPAPAATGTPAPIAPVTPTTTAPPVTAATAPAPASTPAPATAPSTSSPSSGSSTTPSSLPPVKHVFLIVLADERYDQSFGTPAADPYLATTLRKQGELVPNYYAVASGDLANELALLSGQGPTPQTEANCQRYANLEPAVSSSVEQVLGSGCIYPKSTLSLADQLTSAGKTWKAYVEGMGDGPHGQAKSCRHPALGAADAGQAASLHDPYATWTNPFVYFQSIGKTACGKNDVALTKLAGDLKSASTTPSLSYIVPSPCDDGNPQPCVPGAEAGLKASDRFLRGILPEILASPAYKDSGVIAITFDQAPKSGPYADTSACCSNPTTYPNLGAPGTTTTPTTTTPTTTTPTTTTPTTTTPTPTTATTTNVPYAIVPPATTTPTTTTPTTTTPTTTTPTTTVPVPLSEQSGQTTPTGGGGEVGLLLISQYVKANTTDLSDYFNHYSLLSSLEKLFSLKRLGYATDAALPSFAGTVWSKYKP